MNIAVRYYTRSGNTEKLAKAIANALDVQAESIEKKLTEKADVLFLGCSYYAFDVDEEVKKYIVENKESIGKIICFGTSAMMKSVHKPMKTAADAAGVTLSAEEFHCRGAFGLLNKGRPNAKDLQKAAEFAKNAVK